MTRANVAEDRSQIEPCIVHVRADQGLGSGFGEPRFEICLQEPLRLELPDPEMEVPLRNSVSIACCIIAASPIGVTILNRIRPGFRVFITDRVDRHHQRNSDIESRRECDIDESFGLIGGDDHRVSGRFLLTCRIVHPCGRSRSRRGSVRPFRRSVDGLWRASDRAPVAEVLRSQAPMEGIPAGDDRP